jgi:hypothetical protein
VFRLAQRNGVTDVCRPLEHVGGCDPRYSNEGFTSVPGGHLVQDIYIPWRSTRYLRGPSNKVSKTFPL